MATTKLWKVVKRMDHVIDYAEDKSKTKNLEFKNNYEIWVNDLKDVIDYAKNSDKTEKEYFVTGINCDSNSAYEEMKDTKRYYNKQDKILAFHAYQSFVEGEVTPELAHEIGVQLASEMWGDRFQVIVTTHLNTNHIHNHFVLNSVSYVDGNKYYSNRTNTARLRHISDEICREYGLSVLEEKICKKSKINFDNYYKKSLYTDNYSNNAKRDLDLAIRQAYSYDDFLYLMKKLDYEIIFRTNKISIRKEPYKRNIRIERAFGSDYSIDNINNRIENTHLPRIPFIESYNNDYNYKKEYKKNKAHGLYGLFKHYCYILKVYPTKYPRKVLPVNIRLDLNKMEEISNQTRLLVREKIETHEQFLFYKEQINREIQELISKKHNLWIKHKRVKTEEEKLLIRNQINEITKELKEKRKEVVLCDGIEKRSKDIEESIKELEERERREINEFK